ncbi:MAG: bacteriohemerythrin [Verrucomicrobia bacterium]|nr:bacteriohemerythrin [Verrucomicrobiota bacterium]
MALIVWDDSIKVGLWTIDTQHERWVGLINDLHEAMLAGKGKAILGQTLAVMVDYTRTHFADEEDLMSTHGYAGYAEHKALHDACIVQVLDLQRRAQAGELGISRDVLNYLKNWLTQHIKAADRDFVPFLKSKGVL